MSNILLTPISHSGHQFKNRLVMASMGRCRCDMQTGAPNDLVKEYYSQRAESAAIIFAEGMPVAANANPWPGSGAVYDESSIPLWTDIINEVHKKNCRIFAQFYHGGRIVHPDLNDGYPPLAPSAVRAAGDTYVPTGKKPFETPKEMTQFDIDEVKGLYRRSIKHAKQAGFDGVQISGGSGLLVTQFLMSSTNQRTDNYGGSVENRARFFLELVDIALQFFTADQVSAKMTPVGRSMDQFDANPKETLAYVLTQLQKRNIFCVEIVEAEDYITENSGTLQIPNAAEEARKTWKGLLITSGFRPLEKRALEVEKGNADFVGIARLFIANPDLSTRIKNKNPLSEPKMEFAYTGGAQGYADYPTFAQLKKTQSSNCGCGIF